MMLLYCITVAYLNRVAVVDLLEFRLTICLQRQAESVTYWCRGLIRRQFFVQSGNVFAQFGHCFHGWLFLHILRRFFSNLFLELGACHAGSRVCADTKWYYVDAGIMWTVEIGRFGWADSVDLEGYLSSWRLFLYVLLLIVIRFRYIKVRVFFNKRELTFNPKRLLWHKLTWITHHRHPRLLLLLMLHIGISVNWYSWTVGAFFTLLCWFKGCKGSLRPRIHQIISNLHLFRPFSFLLKILIYRCFVLLRRCLLLLLGWWTVALSGSVRHIISVIIRRRSITGTQEFLVVTFLFWRSLRDFVFYSFRL